MFCPPLEDIKDARNQERYRCLDTLVDRWDACRACYKTLSSCAGHPRFDLAVGTPARLPEIQGVRTPGRRVCPELNGMRPWRGLQTAGRPDGNGLGEMIVLRFNLLNLALLPELVRDSGQLIGGLLLGFVPGLKRLRVGSNRFLDEIRIHSQQFWHK